MLMLLLCASALAALPWPAPANGFPLDDCPFDRAARLDGELVGDALDAFYGDLADVGAVNESSTAAGAVFTAQDRSNGLETLKAVLRFNYDADRLYGIAQSPDLERLAAAHLSSRDESAPLMETGALSTVVADGPGDVRRTGVKLRLLNRAPVPRESVEDILCEFAQKLAALGVSSPAADDSQALPDYSDVLAEARRIDADFADELQASVVAHIGTDIVRAIKTAYTMSAQLNQPVLGYDPRESFTGYFDAELRRRFDGACQKLHLQQMQDNVTWIQSVRRRCAGLSVGKMLELQAKVAFKRMTCLHKSLESAGVDRSMRGLSIQ